MTLEEISNRYTIPQNVEALKAILANPRAWKAVDEMFIKTVNELAGSETFITDPSNDYYEVKRAKEDYYLDYLMSCKTGQYILTTKAKFRGLQNGDVITEFSTRFKLYIKKSAVEVHELHTRTMAIHDYNVTFE